jgi:hypothetical protein
MTMVNGAVARSAVDSRVLSGLKMASNATGVDFSYLLAQASMESSLKPKAEAATSSATGLFQFIDQTWLQTFREHGGKYGQAALADQIEVNANGRASVRDPALRQHILDLRKDPTLASALGAELARDNGDVIETALGREAGPTELYIAHFLGAGGATSFLSALGANRSETAANLFPEAAAANRSIFYNASGHARSLGEVYDGFAGRMAREIRRFTDLPMPAGVETAAAWSTSFTCGPAAHATGSAPKGGMVEAMRALTRTGATILSPTLVATLAALPVPGSKDDPSTLLARRMAGLDASQRPDDL